MDIRSFFSPTGKTAKQGASKVENKRGKDSTAKSLTKQDVGKRRTKTKGLSSSEDDDIARKQKPKENQKKKKKKGKNIIDSDSDEDPLPPRIRKATSVKKEESSKAKKNRRPISLDSDEEEVVPSKLKKSAKQTENVASKGVQQVEESPVKPKEKKATSALDFFGSTPVERESRKTFANKRKQLNN